MIGEVKREYAKVISTILLENLLKGINNQKELVVAESCIDILIELCRRVSGTIQQQMNYDIKNKFAGSLLNCMKLNDLKKKAALCIGEFGPVLPKKILENIIGKLIDGSKNKNLEISK